MESHAVNTSVGGDIVTRGSGLNITTGAQVDIQPITSFNIAIIPAAAVIIILVIVCIKGCKWFRHYTKARRHEDESCYAEIVHDSDEDCGPIDITSDTMSNVNYDTVSSYCSMYGRTAKDSFATTANLHRQETIRKLSSSPRKEITQNLLLSDEIKEHETENGDTVYCTGKESIGCGRTMSDSSEETEIDPLFSSFSSDPGRRGMFRVSFTPESHMFSLVDRQNQSNSEPISAQKMQSLIARRNTYSHKPISLKRPLCFPSKYTSPSTTKALFNSVISVHKKQDSPCVINQRPNMISTGVQTDKSFIYSVLLKTNKRHTSDSSIDNRPVPPTRLVGLTETNEIDNQKPNNLPFEAKRSYFKSDSISNIKCAPIIITDRNTTQNKNETPTISRIISDEIGVNYAMENYICHKYPIEPNILVHHKQNEDELTFTKNVVDYEDDVFVTPSIEIHDPDIADMSSCRRTDTNSDQCWTDNSSHVHDQKATVSYNVSDSCDTSIRPYMQYRCQSLPCLYQLINNSRAMYIEPIENKVKQSTTTTDESRNKIIDNPCFRSCSRITNILQAQSKDMNGNYSNTNAKQLDLCERCAKSYYQYQANALVNYRLLHNCFKDIHPKRESLVNSDGHNSSMNSLASSGYTENSFDSSN